MLLLMLFASSRAPARRSRRASSRSCRRSLGERHGRRRRPLGIVLGLAVTFTIAIVALAQLVKGIGLASGAARTLAIIVLLAFGAALLIPELAERVQAPLSRLARFGPSSRGTGFVSGLAVGGGAGLRVRPVRRTDPRGGDLGQRASGATRGSWPSRWPTPLGLGAVMLLYASAAAPCSERIRRVRPGHVGRAHAGRGADRHRDR